ncbi:MAG: ATP synthase F1 subunit epsilon [Bacteroidales bacterium]|nr:ATP synthase F1 subunit epsilon [Bacteroidales bacterium]
MNLDIRTPANAVYSGEVSLVQLPGIDGLFEILEHHAPLVAALQKGIVKIETKEDKQTLTFDINGGVVEVLHDKILILAE